MAAISSGMAPAPAAGATLLLAVGAGSGTGGDGATLAEQLLDVGPAVATQVEQRYLVGQVQQALGRLPAKEQQVVSGIFLRDCEAKELAEELNVTLSHVYRLQKQGVRRIRGILSRFMQHW